MQTTDPVKPFEVQFASRVDRLPYMFGRINNSLYQKRRAGDDVIDWEWAIHRPPDPLVIQKLAASAADEANHVQQIQRDCQSAREVARILPEVWRTSGSGCGDHCLFGKQGRFSHMCLALMGPGDTAMIPSPIFPCVTCHPCFRQRCFT